MPKSDLLVARFAAFVAEQHPESAERAVKAFASVLRARRKTGDDVSALRKPLRAALAKAIAFTAPRGVSETTPGVSPKERLRHAQAAILDACDGFLTREAIRASLTKDERREILYGMLLTRATDNRLKAFFTGGEVRHGKGSFQGKGFRSLGQEAIYA